jgi:hypothetical protein
MTAAQLPDPGMALDLERLARTELSSSARLRYVGLGLVSSAMTIVVMSLWLTEPALPTRTAVAFAVLAAIGIGWVAFSVWVLSVRRVMLARQRLVAGRLAVLFAAAFAGGCLVLVAAGATPAAGPAALMGLGLLGVALVVWRRARNAHARLLARKDALEREVGGGAR